MIPLLDSSKFTFVKKNEEEGEPSVFHLVTWKKIHNSIAIGL